jgi:anti-sigma factor RsiW
MSECEKYKPLLMGLIDQELTPEESQDVNDHLRRCSGCREEYEEIRETASKINAVSFEEPQDRDLKRIWKSPYSRFVRNSGLFLVLAGWLALIFYGLIELFRDSGEPVFSRIAVAAVIIGFLVLLISVIRERMITFRTDPYKEIKR